MASTVSQCTRDTIYTRDSHYVVPCVCERTSKLNVGVAVSDSQGFQEVSRPVSYGLVINSGRCRINFFIPLTSI